MKVPARLIKGFSLSLVLLFSGCGIVGEGDPKIRACLANPIIYVNDPALNDSLDLAIISGLQFSIVPGVTYTFIVDGSNFAGSKLYLERVLSAGTESYGKPVIGTLESGGETHFSFESVSDTSELVWGVVRNTRNGPIFNAPDDVKLVAEGDNDGNSFGINYHFLGSLAQAPDDTAKMAFRDSIHTQLKNYFSEVPQINLSGSEALISDFQSSVTVDLAGGFEMKDSLKSGNDNFINVVFVQTLTPTGLLGFAQRNGFSLNEKSIVVVGLANYDFEVSEVIAHEIGHFLGLRHTVPTTRDILGERDLSNLDDGFADTPNCEAIRSIDDNYQLPSLDTVSVNAGCAYRMARRPAPALCDTTNLMYPDNISGVSQGRLSSSQIGLIKKNLSIFPH